jgi:hypothetical protein
MPSSLDARAKRLEQFPHGKSTPAAGRARAQRGHGVGGKASQVTRWSKPRPVSSHERNLGASCMQVENACVRMSAYLVSAAG